MSGSVNAVVPPVPQRTTSDIPPPPSEVAAQLGLGPSGEPRSVKARTAYGLQSARSASYYEEKKKRIQELTQSGWGCPRIRAEDVEQNRRGITHRAYKPLGQFVPWEDLLYGKYVNMGVPFGSQNYYKEMRERKELAQAQPDNQLEEMEQNVDEYSTVHYKREPAPPPSSGFQTLRRRIRESEQRLRATQAGGHFLDHVTEQKITAPPVTPSEELEEDESQNQTQSTRPGNVPPLKIPEREREDSDELHIPGQATLKPSISAASGISNRSTKSGSQTHRVGMPRSKSTGSRSGAGDARDKKTKGSMTVRYTRFTTDRRLDPIHQLEQTRTVFRTRKAELDTKLEDELGEQELNRTENYKQKFRAFHLAIGEPIGRSPEEEEDVARSPLIMAAAAEALGKLLVRAQRATINAPPHILSAATAAASGSSGASSSSGAPGAPPMLPLPLPNVNIDHRRGSSPAPDAFANLNVGILEEIIRESRAAAEVLSKIVDSNSKSSSNDDDSKLKAVASEALSSYRAASQRRRGSVFSASLLEKSTESSFYLEADRVMNHLNLAASAPDERTRVIAIEQLGSAKTDIKHVPKSIVVMKEILEGKAGVWGGAETGALAVNSTPKVNWRHNAGRDLAAMRLEARRARLQRLITNHRHHPWYIDLLAEVTRGGREISVPEQLIINQVKRLVELGQKFDTRMFYSIVRSVRPVDMRNVDVQKVLGFLRERAAEIPFTEYARWLVAHNLPVPQPVSRGRNADSNSPGRDAEDSKGRKQRMPSTLSNAMYVDQARRRLRGPNEPRTESPIATSSNLNSNTSSPSPPREARERDSGPLAYARHAARPESSGFRDFVPHPHRPSSGY